MSKKGVRLYDNILTKEFLIKEYVINNKSLAEIGRQVNITHQTVSKYLKIHNINQVNPDQLQGKKFGKLVAIEICGKRESSQTNIWLFKCDCGNFRKIDAGDIKRLENLSCLECIERKYVSIDKPKGSESPYWKGCGEISGYKWGIIEKGAIERNLDFSIDIQYAWDKFIENNGKCALSGVDLVFAKTREEQSNGVCTASLDRIDSKIGYTRDNIWWVHKDVNMIKSNITIGNFLYICYLITMHEISYTKYALNLSKENITNQHWYTIQQNASKRNLQFDITRDYILDKFISQGGRCYMSGINLSLWAPKRPEWHYRTASLDRINNDLGYIEGNVAWCHKLINKSRKRLSIEYYKKLCSLIHTNSMGYLC